MSEYENTINLEFECGNKCGFGVHSKNETEMIDVVKKHAMDAHRLDVNDNDVRSKMKTVRPQNFREHYM